MGRSDKVSLWYVALLINTRFRFCILEQVIVKRISCYIKTRNFQMTQGGYQVIIILPIKSKMAAAKKQCFPGSAFCDFCILLNLHLYYSKSVVYK